MTQPADRPVRRPPWIAWTAAFLVLALATLHLVVPHNPAQHQCTVCRTLHAPSLAGTEASSAIASPDSFQTFPRTEERPLALDYRSLPTLRGPPAPPSA